MHSTLLFGQKRLSDLLARKLEHITKCYHAVLLKRKQPHFLWYTQSHSRRIVGNVCCIRQVVVSWNHIQVTTIKTHFHCVKLYDLKKNKPKQTKTKKNNHQKTLKKMLFLVSNHSYMHTYTFKTHLNKLVFPWSNTDSICRKCSLKFQNLILPSFNLCITPLTSKEPTIK